MELPISVGEIVANKYRIDRFIGAGGMGVVFAAFHLELEQPVAIKFLKHEAGSRVDASERFRREARAAARIHSEHVVRVLDIELLPNGAPYMVMELLDGNDLERELEHAGPLPVPLAVDYLLQAIDAVAEAHAAGVVHRDLKPTNLFLARRSDGSRSVKVLDFGISKLIGPLWGPDAALTRSASIFGSPLYMSPEQMRSSKDVDARADIWSLGAILYELCAGRPPYVADSMPALCVAIMTDLPHPLRELVAGVPPELEAVLLRCLARESSDRYANVADLASALAPFTPSGQVHSERARRLLRHSHVNPGATTALVSSDLFTPVPRGPTPPAVMPAKTEASWEKTGGRVMTSRNYALLGAALVCLSAGIWLARRAVSSPTVVVHSALSAVPREAPPPAAASEVATPPIEPVTGEVTDPAPASSAAPSASPPPITKSAKLQRTAAPRPAPARSKPTPTPIKDAALTDFGGRLY